MGRIIWQLFGQTALCLGVTFWANLNIFWGTLLGKLADFFGQLFGQLSLYFWASLDDFWAGFGAHFLATGAFSGKPTNFVGQSRAGYVSGNALIEPHYVFGKTFGANQCILMGRL